MNIIQITELHLKRIKNKLLYFTVKYGERRITRESLDWMKVVTKERLQKQGSSIFAAVDQGRIIGLCCAEDYGKNVCFVVVHPDYRGKGLGARLIRAQLDHLGEINCKVAIDNISSLRMCLNAGLKASRFITGAANKPTLLLYSTNSVTKSR
jgi:GNAT superfamily N-acetyltransferase